MITPFFAAVLPVALNLLVAWSDVAEQNVDVNANALAGQVGECLDRERPVEIRFEVKLCQFRPAWFDSCVEPRIEIHGLLFDPISESFKVVSDRFDDTREPISLEIPSRAAAIEQFLKVSGMPVTFVAQDRQDLLPAKHVYIRARAQMVCKGPLRKTWARIRNIVTLGIVGESTSDLEWTDFFLHR